MTTHELTRGLQDITRALIIKSGRIEHELIGDIAPDSLTALMA
jgi:hypothetical protein